MDLARSARSNQRTLSPKCRAENILRGEAGKQDSGWREVEEENGRGRGRQEERKRENGQWPEGGRAMGAKGREGEGGEQQDAMCKALHG